jgi:hypothetical protein
MKKIIIGLMAIVFSLSIAITAMAATKNATSTTNLSCVKTAVEKRENAIISAYDKLATDMKAALEKRKNALIQAWGISDAKARRAARLAVWKTYKIDQLTARKTNREAIKNAWQQFYTDGKACKVEVQGAEPAGLDTSVANTSVSSVENSSAY